MHRFFASLRIASNYFLVTVSINPLYISRLGSIAGRTADSPKPERALRLDEIDHVRGTTTPCACSLPDWAR